MNGSKFIYTPSKTVCRVLSSRLGDSTEAWIGSMAKLTVGYFDTVDDNGLPCKKPKIEIAQLPSNDPEKVVFDVTPNTPEDKATTDSLSDEQIQALAEQSEQY